MMTRRMDRLTGFVIPLLAAAALLVTGAWEAHSAPRSAMPDETPVAAAPAEALPALAEAELASAALLDVSGDWVGVFQSYPRLVRMTLRLDPVSGDRLEGELRLEPLVEQRGPRGPMGVARVSATYDPVFRILEFTPTAEGRRQTGLRLQSFLGVLDGEGTVGGVLVGGPTDSSPYFILARPGNARFLDRLSSDGGRSPGGILRGFTGAGLPNQQRLLEWVGRFLEEYPDVNAGRTQQGALFLMARNLFRDEFFKPYFGRSYDELGPPERSRVQSELQKIARPRANFPEERPNGVARAMRRAFGPSGTFTAPDITLSVIALRSIDAWKEERRARVQALEPADASIPTLTVLEAAEAQLLATFWPSERTAAGQRIAEAKGRVALPALAARIDRAIAEARGLRGALELAGLIHTLDSPPAVAMDPRVARRQAELERPYADDRPLEVARAAALVPEADRQRERARLAARLDGLLAELMVEERRALAGLGGGLDGLEAGVGFYQNFIQRYGSLATARAPQEVLRELAEQRRGIFPAAESALSSRINAAESTGSPPSSSGTCRCPRTARTGSAAVSSRARRGSTPGWPGPRRPRPGRARHRRESPGAFVPKRPARRASSRANPRNGTCATPSSGSFSVPRTCLRGSPPPVRTWAPATESRP